MGLAASQARYVMLTAKKSNLEFTGQQINQERTILSDQTQDLYDAVLLLDTPDPALVETDPAAYQAQQDAYESEYNQINAEIETYQQQDRQLEINLRNVDTSQQAVQTEIEAVQKVIDKNIEQTFKTFSS